MSEIDALVELGTIDMEAMRLKKELEELPEAAQIMECRAKRKELKAKQDQVVELTDDVESKLAKFQAEEEGIIAKLKDLQETLDTTRDYRVTQSVTRDMEGQVKRQGTIVAEMDALLERQIQVDKLYNQVSGMLHNLDHKEAELTEAFKLKGGKIKDRLDVIGKKRKELLAALPEALGRKYEKLRAEKGGIGLAFLDGHTCSVCRSEILEGNLRRLQAGPELAECPNCHRLFVVKRPEEDEE